MMPTLAKSKYAAWINTALLLWSSSISGPVPLGDLLQFSHDGAHGGMYALVFPVMPNGQFNASPKLPDEMFSVLSDASTQLAADEMVHFANAPFIGVRSIAENFFVQLTTETYCKGTAILFTREYYRCRDEYFHANISQTLRVLKYLVQPPHPYIYPGEAEDDVKEALELTRNKYSSPVCYASQESCFNYSDPVVGYCHFGHDGYSDIFRRHLRPKNDCSRMFRRTFGVNEISYEFNPSLDFWDLYSKKNAYSRMFYDHIHRQDVKDGDKIDALSSDSILDFFIQPDLLEKHSFQEMSPPSIAIHHHSTIPSNFMKLQRGYW